MNDLHVTVETTIDGESVELFHGLYEQAFGALRAKAAARQVLHREEFLAEMSDSRVLKYVARTGTGEPVGVTTLTRHLETVPWISPEYFSARYPEHAAREAIYYAGFTLVAPSARQGAAFHVMIESVVRVLVAERATVGWDICSYNNTRFSFADGIRAVLEEQADVEVAVEDSQTYYAARFIGTGAMKGG
ncbi:hypothetical protein GV794_06235 [Nocardia cyriacigeorgica]|uniref:GNAT family N-acetyltransferase n=1 Tax=Nocardia cyriacigeorgica TaxID=135487 RepID=A0A6P1D198_9NOCA|nr:hypothetical protein [Nocardia cyriacigeorgica]NEW41009.1 hypothetical protein [Nocardia cyriacigeorgica]NEW44275.1 hypothetical protein [Nocardia cyriacigeorgica]NEW51186.1 hypothetical protein [Nocardia cyriacigeorgica]NEW55257.1 hypothetical protein [Nocardia cyriacigeorgica]